MCYCTYKIIGLLSIYILNRNIRNYLWQLSFFINRGKIIFNLEFLLSLQTLQTREACKGYPFQVVFNFVGEMLQMSSTDVHQVSESQLPFDFLSRFVPSLPTKPGFQATDRVTWGVTRIKVCYKREDLRDRQFAMLLCKMQSISTSSYTISKSLS